MGNASAKELQDTTPLGDGTLIKDPSMGVVPALVTKEAMTLKGKGSTWVDNSTGEIMFKLNCKGIMKYKTLVEDGEGKVVAYIFTEKRGINHSTNWICRAEPVFDGQDPVSAEDLKKVGLEGETLYQFGCVKCKNSLTTAKATYSIVTGKEGDELATKELYSGEKLSAVSFFAMFKEGDATVAKASMRGMTINPLLEAGAGVDVLAIVCLGNTLVGDGSAGGALAGAGVV